MRQQLFFSDSDFIKFEALIEETHQQIPLPIYTYELMPNHWHFAVRPRDQKMLSDFFQRLTGTHAKRFRRQHRSVGEGHVYQDRFKSFPVQDDGHFLALCRYIERNALRAGLVNRAEDWKWGGLYHWSNSKLPWLLSDWPITRPTDWIARVNQPLTEAEIRAIHLSIQRGRPLGNLDWTRDTAEQLGLAHSLKPRGRPSIATSAQRSTSN